MTETVAFDLAGKTVWVAGHNGMVGRALMRRLSREACALVTAKRAELDLRDQAATRAFVERTRPNAVIVAAAKVGGILANSEKPADFLYDNLAIETNVIHAAFAAHVEKLLFLGSSCIYPRLAPQPMREDALLTGPLEPTNEWYAIAKIAGLKLCQAYRRQHGARFISAMPTNLYGPHDNFDLATSHVVPALMRKAHEAKLSRARAMTIWGRGLARREFMHVDDLADALVFLLARYEDEQPINVGVGEDISIVEIARLVARTVGFDGELVHDLDKPDGAPRKLLDCSRLHALGWHARIDLADGLRSTYEWYLREGGAAKHVDAAGAVAGSDRAA